MIKLIRLALLAAVVLGATVLMALPKSSASSSEETPQPTTSTSNSASAAGSATAPDPPAGTAEAIAPATAPRNTEPILPGAQPTPAPPPVREVPGTTILPPAPSPDPVRPPQWPKTHVIRPGETLQKIAKQHYGGFSKWRRIADANPGVDPTRIRPGMKLTIPAPAPGR